MAWTPFKHVKTLYEAVPDQWGRAYFWGSILVGFIPGALMAWFAARLDWFWTALGWFGVFSVVLIVWLIVSIALAEYQRFAYRRDQRKARAESSPKVQTQAAPFGKIDISFSGDNDEPGARLEVTLTVKSRARDVVIFGRFATPYHYISDSEWKWSTSSRLIERADLVAGETVRAEIFKRVPMVLDSSDKLKILGQELQLPSSEVTADGCLVLIEIKAMADAADEIAVRRLFQFRRVGARQMIDALDLDSHSFITDQGALR
jgi:hypothetical protein